MKFSALIADKPSDFYRIKNLAIAKKRWQEKIPDVELVIVTNTDEPFNKAKALNQAVKQATGDYFILADADIMFGTKLIDRIATFAQEYHWIIPWQTCYELSKEYSAKFYADETFVLPKIITIKDLYPHTAIIKNHSFANRYVNTYEMDGAYINVISREAFEQIKGLDERFMGWGCEDLALGAVLNTLVGQPYRMDERIFHLYHDRTMGAGNPHYKANEKLWFRYKEAIGDVAAMRAIIDERKEQS
jgi:predicted glycosyltransferase involved in capsule biosynthesis